MSARAPASLGLYRLLRPLARGGMADVFLATRRAAAGVEKRLVLKRIRRERASDPRFLALFVKEARLSVDLAHANIVPVFDFGRVGDDLFLAMEYVDGRDLDAALRRARELKRPLDPVLVAHIGAEACQALDYAHRRRDPAGRALGLVHRDVSPRNVLLSFAGEVKLVDFGVASLHADEQRGGISGTPAFMAPEQARGEPVDGRADLFSLGLVLADALGATRAPGDSLALARAGHVVTFPAGVPADLRAAVERALAVDPAARYPDARAFHQALDAFVLAARAANPDHPSHQLAAWLRLLFPEPEPETVEPADPLPPVVTFLDGEGLYENDFASGSEEARGDQRSQAETVASVVVEPSPARPPRRWPLLAGAGGAALLAAAALLFARSTSTQTPPPPAPASVSSPVPVPDPTPKNPTPNLAPAPNPNPTPTTAPAPVEPATPKPTTRPTTAHPRPAAPPATPSTPAARHPVEVNSRPWAKLYVDGKYMDDTPCRVSLPAGTYSFRFENPHDGSTKTVKVTVPHDGPVVETLTP